MLSSIEKEINEIVSEDETDDTLSSIGDCKRLSFQKIKFENTKLLSRNKNLEIEVNSLRNENENLKEKIDHYDSYFNNLTINDDEYYASIIEEKEQEIEKLNQQIEELQNIITNKDTELSELRNQIEILTEENEKINQTLIDNQEGFKNDTNEYINQIIAIREAKDKEEEKYKEHLDELEQQNKQLIQNTIDLKCSIKDIQDEHNIAINKMIEQYNTELGNKIQMNQSTYEKEITALKLVHCKLENEFKALKHRQEKLKVLLNEQKEKNVKLRGNIQKLGSKYKDIQKKNKELTEIIKQSSSQNKAIKEDVSEKKSINPNNLLFSLEQSNSVLFKYKLLNEFTSQYTKEINELKKDNQILADKVNSLNKKSRNTHQIVKQDNSKNSLLSLQDLLNTSRSNEDNHSSNRDVVSRMKKRIDFLSEENKTFKKQVEVLAKINEELMNKTKNDQKEKDQLGETIQYLNTKKIFGIKLQLLHYLKDCDLGRLYEKDPSLFHVLSMDEYIDIITDCIGYLDENIVIHRLTGDGASDLLLAPLWSMNKRHVLNQILHTLKIKNIQQGSFIHKCV